MSPPENFLSELHQLRDRMFAIPYEFLQLGCNECRRFGVIQLDAARKTFLSKETSLYRRKKVKIIIIIGLTGTRRDLMQK
jgi:hypothetical protein